MTRGGRCVCAIVLAFAARSEPLLADRWECYVIRTGDTAAQVAVHLTGNAENRYRPWFQIADPAVSTFVPKTSYNDIRPGWLACILQQSFGATANGPRSAATPLRLGGVALLFAAVLLLWYIVDQYWTDRQTTIARLSQFGETFVREFERPLVQHRSSERAVHSRIRVQPDRRRVEVLLAPAAGHRYPNLADHRQNVEYDVARVLDVLGGRAFAPGPLLQQGPWVIIPFEFTSHQEQAGVT